MKLIATYDMYYGPKGPMDAEHPIVRRGEEFEVQPTAQASATERGKHLISNGIAVTQEAWDNRKPKSDENWAWAQAEVARMNGGRAA